MLFHIQLGKEIGEKINKKVQNVLIKIFKLQKVFYKIKSTISFIGKIEQNPPIYDSVLQR